MRKLIFCILFMQAAFLCSCSESIAPAEIYVSSDGIIYDPSDTYTVTAAVTSEAADISDTAVYFTEGGSVYHIDPGCSALANSSDVRSGTVGYAEQMGKARVCSRCGDGLSK